MASALDFDSSYDGSIPSQPVLSFLINILYILKFGESVVYNKSYQTLGKELPEYKAFKCLDFQDQKHLN